MAWFRVSTIQDSWGPLCSLGLTVHHSWTVGGSHCNLGYSFLFRSTVKGGGGALKPGLKPGP